MRKEFIFIIFSLLLITLVSAVPPQSSTSEFGLEIRLPQADSLKRNTDIKLHTHVFNASNGVPILPANGVSCIFHLYNGAGSHILAESMLVDSNGLEWKLDIAGGNFSELGSMNFLIFCNDSVQGGFVSSSVEITETGRAEEDGIVQVFLMIFGLFVFLFLLYTLLNTLKDLAAVKVNMITIGLAFSAYFINLAYYYYLTVFMPINLMLDISLMGISAFGITHVLLPLIGLIFSWIKNGGAE